MADPNLDPDFVTLRRQPSSGREGPWMVGRDHLVHPVVGDYETQFVITAEDCCSVVGPAPFEYVGKLYIGRALLVIPTLEREQFKVGDTLYFELAPGWGACCGTPVAQGLYTVPAVVPPCIELVQVDGLMHPSLRLRASTGVGGRIIGPVPWRLQILQCCTERKVTYGKGVTGDTPIPP